MQNKALRRVLSIILSLAVFIVFPLSFTQEVQAASTKTFYVTTQYKNVTTSSNGSKSTSTSKQTYDKNGLRTSSLYSSNSGDYSYESKTVYKHNKRGYISAVKVYDKDGKLTDNMSYSYKYNSKGLPVTQKTYRISSGNKTLVSTGTITYYTNGVTKKESSKDTDGGSVVTTYYSSGVLKSYKYTAADGSVSVQTFDKKGSQISYKSNGYSEVHSTMKYDKKGNLVKDVYTVTSSYEGQETEYTVTETTTYTYDSHKNVTKSVTKIVNTMPDGSTDTSTRTYTAKYKAVKVAKKFWRFF